jgi:sugar-specific transcriptional regulator TrmB
MTTLLQKLEALGLNQRETKIYTFLLKNKDLPAYKISTETSIPRTTVYKDLGSLEKQGLTSKWLKNGVKYYSAENPRKLKMLINKKQEILEEVFPELSNMFDTKTFYPNAKLYTGKEGVKYSFEHILETMLREKINLVYAISEKQLTEALPKFFLNWRERKNKKTPAITHLIVPKGTGSHKHYTSDDFRETREMPDKNPVGGSLDIIGNNVYFFSFKEDEIYSIIIESPIVAGMLTQLFKYIWSTLE